MEIVRLNADTELSEPLAATIGFFDGVHLGHRHLISQVVDVAKSEGLCPAVITFDRHPRQVVKSDYCPQLLSTFNEKMALLASTGAQRCIVLPFTTDMAALSAHDFMADVLRRQLCVSTLVIGYDNRFGHNRSEGFDDYVAYGKAMGMEVLKARPLVVDGVNISSTVVRSLLQEGEVAMAARCLARNYTLSGTVVGGEHIGTTLGFPTANLQPCDAEKIVPAAGVYAVMARIDDEKALHPAMMNIGTRPTFNGHATTLEVHLLDFHGDIYGHTMTVAFVQRLREERKFRSAAELTHQLHRDAEQASALLGAQILQQKNTDKR